MKFCFRCGVELLFQQSKYCHDCGAELKIDYTSEEIMPSKNHEDIENYKYFRLLVYAVYYDQEQDFKLNQYQNFIDDLLQENNLHPYLKEMYDKGTLWVFLDSYVKKLKSGEIKWDKVIPDTEVDKEKAHFLQKNDYIDIAEETIDAFIDPNTSIKKVLNLLRDK
ncbi:hypothetical protein [Paucisalibacillus globulus]|uniref:hypothetical protein n=1 Tax=Paucisalibacillus globulus TaxID=351095 RepID=UPI000BB81154|nr:hypothetical protein [Paucisalibacillus globulus]